jgi:hypothetical protein
MGWRSPDGPSLQWRSCQKPTDSRAVRCLVQQSSWVQRTALIQVTDMVAARGFKYGEAVEAVRDRRNGFRGTVLTIGIVIAIAVSFGLFYDRERMSIRQLSGVERLAHSKIVSESARNGEPAKMKPPSFVTSPSSNHRSSWPDWPKPPSDKELAFEHESLMRKRNQLIEVAQLSDDQVRRLDEITSGLNDEIDKAFDSLIAPYASNGKAVPPDELRKYKLASGEAIEKADSEITSLVPGGRATLKSVHFVYRAKFDSL